MEANALHKIYLGSQIIRLALDETGKFYDKRDEKMNTPLQVTPIKGGLDTISIFRYEQEYGPTRKQEIDYGLAGLALCLATEEQIIAGKIGARTNEKRDTIVIDFYRIITA